MTIQIITHEQRLAEKRRHHGGCTLFLKFTHRHGPQVKKEWKACKYHQQKQS